MPSYSKSAPEMLRKRLRSLYDELAATSPLVMQEIRLIEGLLKSVDGENSQPYSGITSPWEAVALCLKLNGNYKFTKAEVMEKILSGGFLSAKPKASRGLLNDSINYHLRKGALSLKKDLLGMVE